MKPETRLIVTDLDGTLLRSDQRLSQYSVRVLNAAIGAGMAVTYATARSHYAARDLLSEVRFQLPAVVYNGAFVVRPDNGARLVGNLLDRVIAAEVVAKGTLMGVPPFVFGFAHDLEVVVHAAPVNEGQHTWLRRRVAMGDGRLTQVAKIALPSDVVEAKFIARPSELTDLATWVRATFSDHVATSLISDTYSPGYCEFTVHHSHANKRDAVCWIAEHVGVPLSAVTAIGDNHNDLPMFEVVGHRLAVANAQVEVLAAAHEVLRSNDQDGVADYLERTLGLSGSLR